MKTFFKAFFGVACALALAQLLHTLFSYKERYASAIESIERLTELERQYRESSSKAQWECSQLQSKVDKLTAENKRLSDEIEFLRISAAADSPIAATSVGAIPSPRQEADTFLQTDERLPNGMIVEDKFTRRGKGTLVIKNGTSGDAYIKVIELPTRKRVAGFYAQAGNEASFEGIPDGSYQIIYAIGFDWSWPKLDFLRSRKAYRFDDIFEFKTTRKRENGALYDYYSINTLTLHKVAGGNVKTNQIPIEEFDKY